jgi:hypothetical protein
MTIKETVTFARDPYLKSFISKNDWICTCTTSVDSQRHLHRKHFFSLSANAAAAVVSAGAGCTVRAARNRKLTGGSSRSIICIFPTATTSTTVTRKTRQLDTVGLRITIIVLTGFIAINSILTVGPDLEVSWKTDTKGVDALLITIDAVGIPITGSWWKGWGTSRNGSSWHTTDLPVQTQVYDPTSLVQRASLWQG